MWLRARRWWRRNGMSFPELALPGIIHQSWGWYDGLPSLAAAFVTAATILFVISTALYLVSANAALQQPSIAAPPTLATGPRPTSTTIPTLGPTTLPTLRTGTGRSAVVIARTGLRLRQQPSTTAPALRDLFVGTRLEIMPGTATADGFRWVEVRIPDGTVGWVVDDGIQ